MPPLNGLTRDTISRFSRSPKRLSLEEVRETIDRFIENAKLNKQGLSRQINEIKEAQRIIGPLNSFSKSAELIHSIIDEFNDTYNHEQLLKQLQVIVLFKFRERNPDPNDNNGIRSLIQDILQPVTNPSHNSSSITGERKKFLSLFPDLVMRELYNASTENGVLDKERLKELVIRFRLIIMG